MHASIESIAASREAPAQAAPRPRLSVVVPCFNEAEGLGELHRRIGVASQDLFGASYEVVLVDDGSKDGTWDRISELVDADPRVTGVKLSRNHGHQLALTAGLAVVRGDLILVVDADLQDPPELLGEMYRLMIEQGADVVYGRRRSRAGESAFKRATASIFYRALSRTTDVDIPADSGDFRLMTRRMADLLAAMPERDRFVRGMIAWLGFKQVPIDYDRDARFAGATKYPLKKMVRFAIDAFLGYSMVLLRLAAIVSFALFAALALMAAYTLYSWAFLDVVPGWASMTMLIVVVSATQLLVLSILGEYIGRIYIELKRRPLFVVEAIKRHS